MVKKIRPWLYAALIFAVWFWIAYYASEYGAAKMGG